MTLILKLDLDMVKMYHHIKNEVSMSTASKVIAQTDRQKHRHDENITSTAHAGGNKHCVNQGITISVRLWQLCIKAWNYKRVK